jgi:putative ABC transport system permease protein
LDQWQEIFATLRRNKLRTALTGFSVAWGIYMLVVLLAAGKGFENGIKSNFKDMSPTLIKIGAGQTSMPHAGIKQGREIKFKETDLSNIQHQISDLDKISPELNVWGDNYVRYETNEFNAHVVGCFKSYNEIDKNPIIAGRFINEKDIASKSKVCVIGSNVKDALFKTKSFLGKYILIKGIPFQVVGSMSDQGKPWRQGRIFIPFTTAQLVYNEGNHFETIVLSLSPSVNASNSNEAASKVKKILAHTHQFNPEDPKALWVFNFAELLGMINGLFIGIKIFIWIIGLGTIVAGIVGVSNIMIIAVKERTKEIGIRKALGAKPSSIVGLIVQESLVITSIFGYIGLAMAVLTIEILSYYISGSDIKTETFNNPEIDISIALIALLILILSGAIAGLIPARKAAMVPPIVALRAD